MKEIQGYHFHNGKTLRDGRPLPDRGVWLVHNGPVVLCQNGFHQSRHPWDALQYAPGNYLSKTVLRGDIIEGEDKDVGRERMIVATVNAERLLHEYGCWCAEQCLPVWEAWAAGREDADDPRKAIEAKRAWLRGEISDEELSAARSAASAACSAARSVAYSAYIAAYSAAHSARSAAYSARSDAYSAAYSAADSAARSAAYSAYSAYSAAYSAAFEQQREKLLKIVEAEFAKQGGEA